MPMKDVVSEARAFHPVSAAYGDLSDAVRALAEELERIGDADRAALDALAAPAPAPAPTADEHRREREQARVAVDLLRCICGVLWQALVSGVVLAVGFHVWMTLFPPLRPTP